MKQYSSLLIWWNISIKLHFDFAIWYTHVCLVVEIYALYWFELVWIDQSKWLQAQSECQSISTCQSFQNFFLFIHSVHYRSNIFKADKEISGTFNITFYNPFPFLTFAPVDTNVNNLVRAIFFDASFHIISHLICSWPKYYGNTDFLL